MNNKGLFIVSVVFLLIGCKKDPLADFSISDTVVGIGDTVYFNNNSADAESFEWDFGDGTFSNSFNAYHFYDLDGIYNVSLTAVHKNRSDIAHLTLSVIRNLSADFTVSDVNIEIGDTVFFYNKSIDAESFEWDFGDGSFSNSFNASHNYNQDGVYTIKLRAFYNGCVDIAYSTVSVIGNLSADFTVSEGTVGISDTIYFTNKSTGAESYEWDFGDGTFSNSVSTSHFYNLDGVYTVSLKAINNGTFDFAYKTINVIGASIEITVEEYYEPNYLVPDISVILYPSLTDWENQTNKGEEKFTNSSGIVSFDHLATHRYFVDVWGPNHDNYQLAAEDVGFIQTPVLVPGAIISFTAFVDYYPNVKKSITVRHELKAQRKIDAMQHLPRKKSERK